MTQLAATLEAFFTDRLLCQQRVSPNTIASYRDTFRLLCRGPMCADVGIATASCTSPRA